MHEFSENQAVFYELINNFPYLPEKERKSIIDYLDEFYDLINGRNAIINRFSLECNN